MIDLTRDTFKLVIENKLFKNPGMAYGQIFIGAVGTAIVLVILAFTGIPVWLCAAVAGLAGGFAMPYLFKDIKFK